MNARRFFLLFFLCAVIPVAAAKLSLSLGWFSGGATNKGQWLDKELQFIPALTQGDVHWTIAYVNTGPCEQHCKEAIGLLRQLYAGLGRKQLGVQAMVISDNAAALAQIENQFTTLKTVSLPTQLHQSIASGGDNDLTLHHQFFIINQQGVALLRYSLEDPAQDDSAPGRALQHSPVQAISVKNISEKNNAVKNISEPDRFTEKTALYAEVAADLRADLLKLYNYDRSRL